MTLPAEKVGLDHVTGQEKEVKWKSKNVGVERRFIRSVEGDREEFERGRE